VLDARVVATRIYEKRIAKLLPPDERTEMENAVAADPERYPVVPGTKENLTDADKKEIRKIVENLKRTN
jgi:hypothetical protein